MEKKKNLIIGIIAIFFILFAIYFTPFEETEPFISNDYKYGGDYSKELDDIPILSQETEYTCYIVSMAIVKNYFGSNITEKEIRNELGLLNRSEGMLPNEYLDYINKFFEPMSYSVTKVNPSSQAEILNVISDSLEKDLPVVIFYSAKDDWNKPHYNTHYAVVYGIDMEKKIVMISNPYGYMENLTFEELFEGLDFTNYNDDEPLLFKLARKVGMVENNNIFIFNKIKK